jgi:glycosyltransferase involved in cell wall biosynthesis
MTLYFLGGLLDIDESDFIAKNSKGVVQNAAHVFQFNIIKGLVAIYPEFLVVNLPFVGSYPAKFKKPFLKSSFSLLFNNCKVLELGFCNISIVKYFSRAIKVFSYFIKNKPEKNSVVLIYSLHFPFILGSVLSNKILANKFKIFLIVPDLPEYMSDGGGLTYRIFKYIETKLLEITIKSISGHILLTQHMAAKLALEPSNYIVVEGIATDSYSVINHNEQAARRKVIFYSGTLATRYGVKDLVDAFTGMDDSDLELWICGAGDSSKFVHDASLADKRIKFFGQIPRDEVLKLQAQSTILVNPRNSAGEYTKYSFPSKIIEYMSTGIPVVMHALPGIPDNYFDYCYIPECESVEGLRECLRYVLSLSSKQLFEKGRAAQQFVLTNKSGYVQALRIKEFIDRFQT